jgi:hypothetical protein
MKHYRSRSNLRRSRKPKSRNNRRRRTYRYMGGAAGGAAGAAAAVAGEIAALNAVFDAAVLQGNLKKDGIKKALGAHRDAAKAAGTPLSRPALDHMLTLIQSISHHPSNAMINSALLSANSALLATTRDAAHTGHLVRNVLGDRPDVLKTSYEHSGNSKSQPAKPASPKHSPRSH